MRSVEKVKQLEATLTAVNRSQFERLPYPIIVGSGAAESVLPTEWAPQAQLLPSSSAGKTYSAAKGSTIRNKGSKIVSAVSKEGELHNLQFEVANVTKALASVPKICSKDQSVIYNPPWHEEGSYIYNWNADAYTGLLLGDGVYVLDTLIAPIEWQAKPSFGRPGY